MVDLLASQGGSHRQKSRLRAPGDQGSQEVIMKRVRRSIIFFVQMSPASDEACYLEMFVSCECVYFLTHILSLLYKIQLYFECCHLDFFVNYFCKIMLSDQIIFGNLLSSTSVHFAYSFLLMPYVIQLFFS